MEETREQNWPRAGDSLFGNDGASERTHAVLDDPFVHGFVRYARSYNEAADMVVDAVRTGNAHPDSVIYAVLYLYRHSIELLLKTLISVGTALEERLARYPTNEHRLTVLWAQVRPFLERAFPQGDRATTDDVERRIEELASMDVDGQASRYPERWRKDSLGQQAVQPTIPNAVHIDLENVGRVVGRVAAFLEGSYDAMDELVQIQADLDSGNAE